MKLKSKFFILIVFVIALTCFINVKPKATIIFNNDHLEDNDAFIFTFAKSDLTERYLVFSLDEYDFYITAYDYTINYRGSYYDNNSYDYDFLSFYVQYTYNRYDVVIVESYNFKLNDLEATQEIFRGYLQTPSTQENITIYLDNANFFSLIGLEGNFYDDIVSLRNYLTSYYNNTFNYMTESYYINGYDTGYYDGSRININDYIKKDDATSWISGIFEAFGDFFAIKIGPVSIGAIVIMPVAISLVWFILRMFRGGGAS